MERNPSWEANQFSVSQEMIIIIIIIIIIIFFSRLDCSYGNVFNYWKLNSLSARRRYLDVIF